MANCTLMIFFYVSASSPLLQRVFYHKHKKAIVQQVTGGNTRILIYTYNSYSYIYTKMRK